MFLIIQNKKFLTINALDGLYEVDMKKNILMFLVILIISGVFANEWTITKKSAALVDVTSNEGKTASIVMSSNATDVVIEKITNCLNTVWSIPGIEGTKATVNVENDSKFRFVIYPTTLSFDGEDLIKFLPSGMAFIYDNALFYDTVIKVGA